MVRRISAALGLILIGAILGPLAMVVAAGLAVKSDDISHNRAALALLDAYRARLEPLRLLLSIEIPPDGKECGYERSDLFDAKDDMPSTNATRWSPYRGYDALYQWKNRQADERYLANVREYLIQNTSPFSAGFLAACMRQTMFARPCAAYVHDLIEGRGWFGALPSPPGRIFDAPVAEGALCTYLDGLAARNRHPMSDWQKTKRR